MGEKKIKEIVEKKIYVYFISVFFNNIQFILIQRQLITLYAERKVSNLNS